MSRSVPIIAIVVVIVCAAMQATAEPVLALAESQIAFAQ